MGLSSFQGIEIIIIVKWQLTRQKERERLGMEKLAQGLGIFKDISRLVFVGSFFPPFEFPLPIRSRIGTSHHINIDNLSRRAAQLALRNLARIFTWIYWKRIKIIDYFYNQLPTRYIQKPKHFKMKITIVFKTRCRERDERNNPPSRGSRAAFLQKRPWQSKTSARVSR